MIKDTTGIIQAGASATAENNFVLDASAANGTMKLYSGNSGTPVNTVLTVDAAGSITPIAPMHLAAVTPIFSAWQSVAQTVPSGIWTKINFQTKVFDTTNAFDNVTNMRYTPMVAGYYQVSCGYSTAAVTILYLQIYKNGAVNKTLEYKPASSGSAAGAAGSAMVSMNGTTDYLEIYAYLSVGAALVANAESTYFQATLIARV
jgi:hypothetical protein